MRGGGRNREIQRLQAAAAQNGGEGTARQQERLSYLQSHRDAGRRPQGPQTGGPLQEAMGLARDGANRAAGGNDLRMQQPYNGGNYKDGILDSMRGRGPGMSNGGTTWDGQAPMNPYGGGQAGPAHTQPAMISPDQSNYRNMGFNNQAEFDNYKAARGAAMQGMQGNYKDGIAGQLSQMQGQAGAFAAPTEQQRAQSQEMVDAANRRRQELSAGRPGDPNQFIPMQRPTPGNMPGQEPNMPPGFQTYPLKMSQEDLVKRYPPGTQIPGLPRPGQQGPDYFRGQGMDMGKFNQPGYQAPQRQVQGNQIAGGGTTMDRFSKPGYTAPQRNVAGDQIRGGGSPGLSRRRVNTDPNRRGQPAGVLAPIPR